MNRRTFIKTATVGGAFLPVFAKLGAPAQSGEADVNVAVIGFGSAGQALAAGMIRMTGVRVRCVCDIWKFQRQRAVAFFKSYGHGVEVYEDYREMLDKEERNIDAVIVATPDWMHGEQVCACLARGKHVYCETPMAVTAEQAAEMCRTARRTGRLLQIGLQRRSNPQYRLAMEHLVPEVLLHVHEAQARWNRNGSPFFAVKRPPKQDLLSRYGYESVEQFLNWMWFPRYARGPVMSFMPHQTDLFCWAWRGGPVSVTALGGRDRFSPPRQNLDALTCLYEFAASTGPTGRASQIFSHVERLPFWEESFSGMHDTLHLAETPSDGNFIRRGWGGTEAERGLRPSWKTFVDRGWVLPSRFEKEKGLISECHETDVAIGQLDAPLGPREGLKKGVLVYHLENFFSAIRGKELLNCPAEQAYVSFVVLLGAIRSAERRETVRFRPEDFLVPEGNA